MYFPADLTIVCTDLEGTLWPNEGGSLEAYARGYHTSARSKLPTGLCDAPDGITLVDRVIRYRTFDGLPTGPDDVRDTVRRIDAAFGRMFPLSIRPYEDALVAMRDLRVSPLHHCTVVTANSALATILKVTSAGMTGVLDLESGAYGCEHVDRGALVELASHRVAETLQLASVSPKQVVVIGDTVADAEAARRAGTSFLGVLTGSGTADQLAAHISTWSELTGMPTGHGYDYPSPGVGRVVDNLRGVAALTRELTTEALTSVERSPARPTVARSRMGSKSFVV
ncbi:HAD family hydrolase [Actinoalloteichus caeruleus]|uniref:HAD family hydrolase n=1 Tax=Actinoalloteichus cyanogriseus TaxID=2893586 RepID=UPI003BB94423